jgi:hypothetical protein
MDGVAVITAVASNLTVHAMRRNRHVLYAGFTELGVYSSQPAALHAMRLFAKFPSAVAVLVEVSR